MVNINKNYREFRLDNGLFVALQETPTQTVSGRLRVWHGALNEQKGEEGLAHFLEHTLMSGGSQKYDPKRTDEIRGTFGAFNAFTGLERTFFPVDLLAEDSQLFLEYISDVTFNPRFDVTRVDEERQRVLRETANAKSDPVFKDNKAYAEAFFGKNSPHNYFILGDETVVGSASIDALRRFHSRGYHPNNMDLVLVGALPKEIENLIQQNFGSFNSGDGKKIEFPKNSKLNGPKILHTFAPDLYNHESPEQSSAQLSISLVAPTETDEDSYAVNMLAKILGGDANSRLFTSVSQRKGLAYGVYAQYDGTNNKGIIFIGGSVHSVRADEAIETIFEEMAKLRTDLVSQESLERLKRNSRYHIAKTFETNKGHVNAIELKIDKGLTFEDHLERMEAVIPEKIREVAIKYLPQNRTDGKYVLILRDSLKK
ncbi:MAG: insulinase family protein [Nanoarchaeota archaeon]|nr:insulinase family protein [Nanoarchaeota archaeon]MBU1644636.1 insulinase family protein [Nanoarchaeota archaeon]MBU1976877.1 insulinase family protein [Nanoarchaeota archaeon]